MKDPLSLYITFLGENDENSLHHYRFHQLYLERRERYYVPLPKLSEEQFAVLSGRLGKNGFTTEGSSLFRRATKSVRVGRQGLASANFDLADLLAPVIPEILSVKSYQKKAENPYYVIRNERGRFSVQLKLRIESLATWRDLRASDLSGLTPDEAAVFDFVTSQTEDPITCITDYPKESGRTVQIGRRVFYECNVERGEFLSNLRTIEVRNIRNTYPVKSATLNFKSVRLPSHEAFNDFRRQLGDWCHVLF
jgi:hypothetical protein